MTDDQSRAVAKKFIEQVAWCKDKFPEQIAAVSQEIANATNEGIYWAFIMRDDERASSMIGNESDPRSAARFERLAAKGWTTGFASAKSPT